MKQILNMEKRNMKSESQNITHTINYESQDSALGEVDSFGIEMENPN